MKIILNNKFQIERVEDKLEDALVKGSTKFDLLSVYIPTELKETFSSIAPMYSVKRADGRKLGPYGTLADEEMFEEDLSIDGYYGWAGYFNPRDLGVKGALEITIAFIINDSTIKTAAMVTTNVVDAIEVDDDIFVIGDNQIVTSLVESVKNLLVNSLTMANDVVQNYAALTSYPTTDLPDGFRVLVMNDSNQNNNPVLYQWNGTTWENKGYFDWTGYLDTKFDNYKETLDDYVDGRLDSQDQTIAGLGQLQPSGIDTSTNILAFTTNKGIYIGSDTGYWYYWDATDQEYKSGGIYQATAIADGSVTSAKVDNTVVSTKINVTSTSILADFNSAEVNKIYLISITGLSNAPVADGGTLFTFGLNANFKNQIFIDLSNNAYIRTSLNGNWYSWFKVGVYAKTINMISNVTSTSVLNDVNNALLNSIYVFSTTTIPHMPVADGGTLLTFGYLSNCRNQIFVGFNNKMYYRAEVVGSWQSWIQLGDGTKTINSISNVTSTSVLDDLNNALANSIYLISSYSIPNQPAAIEGVLLTYCLKEASNYKAQNYVTGQGETYVRFCSGGTWTNWNKLTKNYTSVGMFEKIGVVGDSYTVGAIFKDGNAIINNYLSWAKTMCRRLGNQANLYGKGGINTRTYLSDSSCLPALLNDAENNLYILALGINDRALGTSYIGDVTDIHDDDYTLNADTFYGNYGKIIQQIKNKAPNCKLIISTMAENVTGELSELFNEAIVSIASHYSIPCIKQYNHWYFKSAYYKPRLVDGHPTAAGYAGMSKAMEELLDEAILNNVNYFKDYLG